VRVTGGRAELMRAGRLGRPGVRRGCAAGGVGLGQELGHAPYRRRGRPGANPGNLGSLTAGLGRPQHLPGGSRPGRAGCGSRCRAWRRPGTSAPARVQAPTSNWAAPACSAGRWPRRAPPGRRSGAHRAGRARPPSKQAPGRSCREGALAVSAGPPRRVRDARHRPALRPPPGGPAARGHRSKTPGFRDSLPGGRAYGRAHAPDHRHHRPSVRPRGRHRTEMSPPVAGVGGGSAAGAPVVGRTPQGVPGR